jgi:hypothetical protein
MSEREIAQRIETNRVIANVIRGYQRQLAEAQADIARKDAAIRRYLDLNSDCDYVNGEPDVCPGIERAGAMCHWCELRAALTPNP